MTNLVEQGSNKFYVHLKINGQKDPAELYWINREWRFRTFAYRGEWLIISTPLEIESLIDKADFQVHLTDFLLTELYYYETFNVLDKELRKKTIEKLFGPTRCEEFRVQMNEFKEALVSVVTSHLGPKKYLKIVK